LWHGANWTFVAWGAFHGALMIATVGVAHLWRRYAGSAAIGPGFRAVGRAVGVFVTFHLVCLGWVLFRADNLGHAWQVVSQLGVGSPVSVIHELTHVGPAPPAATTVELAILLASTVALEAVELLIRTPRPAGIPPAARWLAWASLSVWTLLVAV